MRKLEEGGKVRPRVDGKGLGWVFTEGCHKIFGIVGKINGDTLCSKLL